MRRLLIIIAAVIVLVGIGSFVYFRYFALSPHVAVSSNPTQASLPTAGNAPTSGTSSTTLAAPSTTSVPVSARLVKISSGPVVPGETILDQQTTQGSTTPIALVEYIDQQTGNVYQYSEQTGKSTRISDKTIPGILRAQWLPNGSMAFVQYLSGNTNSTINTYALPSTSNASSTVGDFFLPQGLTSVAVAPTSVLGLASSQNGTQGKLYNPDGSAAGSAFTTPLNAVRASFAGKHAYLVFTKPNANLAGYAYIVKNGVFTRIAGPLKGLVALASPQGSYVLVSYTKNGQMALELIDVATDKTTQLPIATIADKCAWAPDESAAYCGVPVNPPTNVAYPDDWYQGAVHFNDTLWKIDIKGQYVERELNFASTTGNALDAEALTVDSRNSTLVFVNKNTGALWSFQL